MGHLFRRFQFFEINGRETNIIDATFNGSANVVDMIPAGGTIPTEFDSIVLGQFSGFVGSRGYVAVKFGVNFSTPDKYGYLDVEVNGDNNKLTIHGGAYESTANTPIQTRLFPNLAPSPHWHLVGLQLLPSVAEKKLLPDRPDCLQLIAVHRRTNACW